MSAIKLTIKLKIQKLLQLARLLVVAAIIFEF